MFVPESLFVYDEKSIKQEIDRRGLRLPASGDNPWEMLSFRSYILETTNAVDMALLMQYVLKLKGHAKLADSKAFTVTPLGRFVSALPKGWEEIPSNFDKMKAMVRERLYMPDANCTGLPFKRNVFFAELLVQIATCVMLVSKSFGATYE